MRPNVCSRFIWRCRNIFLPFLALSLLSLLFWSNVFAAPIAWNNAIKKGLFIQLPYAKRDKATALLQLESDLQHVCTHHRNPSKDDYVNNLVIQRIANRNGTLYAAELDKIIDKWHCFDYKFIGTVSPRWDSSNPCYTGGHLYTQGIKSKCNRDEFERISRIAVSNFIARYPTIGAYHWYLSYEANLNAFVVDPAIRQGYARLFLQMVNMFHGVKPNRSTLWSPAFWTKYSSTTQTHRNTLATQLRLLFQYPQVYSHNSKGVNWVHFQDKIGDFWCSPNKPSTTDVVNWRNFLLSTQSSYLDDVRINMEMFRRNCSTNGLQAMTPAEAYPIENNYEAKLGNTTLGASFSLRYWMQYHKEL